MTRHPAAVPPRDAPGVGTRSQISGEVGDPSARPGSMFLICLAVVLAGVVILFIASLTSSPEERRPLEATQPESVSPNAPAPAPAQREGW